MYETHEISADISALISIPPQIWNAGRELSRWARGLSALPFCWDNQRSPITRVSDDVLAEIFAWILCDCQGFTSLMARNQLVLEPLTVSHVNSRWRRIALSKPTLWSTIWVDRPREIHIPMVQLWLARSGQSPLNLHLRQTPPRPQQHLHPWTDEQEFELTDEILTLLTEHLHRWRRIQFLFQDDVQPSLLALPVGRPRAAPLLEHVELHVGTWLDSTSAITVQRTLYSYLRVRSVVLVPTTSQIWLPWARLTDLEVNGFSSGTDTYSKVFGCCPLLRSASIICQDIDSVDTARVSPPRRLSHLTSLRAVSHRTDLQPLFNGLILPKLKKLTLIYASAPRRANDPLALEQMLTRSACALERLEITDIAQTRHDDCIISYLHAPALESLVELALHVDMNDSLLKFLTLGSDEDGRPRALPNLRSIALKDSRGDHLTDLALYCMVVSRLVDINNPDPSRYSTALRSADFNVRLKGHHTSPVLPLLVERCRDHFELYIYLQGCDDPRAKEGRYTSPPLFGGYLTEG
ncbi:hypothetical protein C8J57DRAFT_688060 [Mycena rebaudengoi]|nr:hypothetical protein C8J57DRAFT_688060 [Mycena rebaudengoi]